MENRYHITYQPADAGSSRHADIITQLLRDTSSYIKFSYELGWTLCEFAMTEWYTANSAGMRGTKEYEILSSSCKLRIMVCGDGFTHCNDVRNEETWPALLEQMNTGWEVVNFGVWGYALDQAYLQYVKMGTPHKPNIVLSFVFSHLKMISDVFRVMEPSDTHPFSHTSRLRDIGILM